MSLSIFANISDVDLIHILYSKQSDESMDFMCDKKTTDIFKSVFDEIDFISQLKNEYYIR